MPLSTQTEVLKFAYSEVLAALKHQDEKLNRWLTALSFLTAAGIAIYTRAFSSHAYRNTLPHSRQHVVTIFFIFFLVSVLAALIGVLGAIGPNTSLPRWKGSPVTSANRSLIYFGTIYKETDDGWENVRTLPVDALESLLVTNLHHDIQGLSGRVVYKMARAREAGAFSQLAILSLGLLGIFAIPTTEMSMTGRWWVAVTVLTAMLLLPLWELLQMRHHKFPEARSFGITYTCVAVAAAFGITLLAVAPGTHAHWIALLYALGSILGIRLALVRRELVPCIVWPLAPLGAVLLGVAICS